MAQDLIERYESRLYGVLSCYDRLVGTGTLPGACYAQGMTAFLSARGIRIFDYPRFAGPLRDTIRERAQELAAAAGIQIEHIRKDHIRKEDVVAKIRGGSVFSDTTISGRTALHFPCGRSRSDAKTETKPFPCLQGPGSA